MESKLKSLLLKKAKYDGQESAGGYRRKNIRAGNLQVEAQYKYGIANGEGYKRKRRVVRRNPVAQHIPNVAAHARNVAQQAMELSQAAGMLARGMSAAGGYKYKRRY